MSPKNKNKNPRQLIGSIDKIVWTKFYGVVYIMENILNIYLKNTYRSFVL